MGITSSQANRITKKEETTDFQETWLHSAAKNGVLWQQHHLNFLSIFGFVAIHIPFFHFGTSYHRAHFTKLYLLFGRQAQSDSTSTMPSFSVQHGHHHFDTMIFKDDVDVFLYQKDAKRSDRIYLRCCLSDCRGRAVASELHGELRQTKRHNHSHNAYPQDLALRNLLKQRAAASLGSTSNSALFREVTREHDQGTAVSFP